MIETDTVPEYNCVQKAQQIPLLNIGASVLSTVYYKAKDVHPLISRTVDYCEKRTLSVATPLMSNLEKPLQKADSYACVGLDYITNRFPIVNKQPKEVLESAVKPATERIHNLKEYSTGTVTTLINKGQEQADHLLDNKATKIALNGIETGLKGANEMLDQYCPLEDEEETRTHIQSEKSPENPTGKALYVMTLLLHLNGHLFAVAKKQIKQVHGMAMQRLTHLTGIITKLETAKAEGKPSERLLQTARDISGSLLSFYSGVHSLVANMPGLMTQSLDLVKSNMQQLVNIFAKAETISDIPSNMLTFAREVVPKTQAALLSMYDVVREPEKKVEEHEMNNLNCKKEDSDSSSEDEPEINNVSYDDKKHQ